ncbi:hypothetical protein PFLUV_G00061820 [Perca fluviatilis]|uniref:Uncharacterized protein n=1 Tax=Perca fluviatilis TaxID=8168 RepID=A0A6A5FMY1_PERFL|nr:hypothetical protein PFLUV_G00061820 [Perca fluviatilis]
MVDGRYTRQSPLQCGPFPLPYILTYTDIRMRNLCCKQKRTLQLLHFSSEPKKPRNIVISCQTQRVKDVWQWKQTSKPVRSNKKSELERKKDERAARRAIVKDRKNRPQDGDEGAEFVSFSNQLQALGLKLREVPGDGKLQAGDSCLIMTNQDVLVEEHNVFNVSPAHSQ